MPRRKLKHFAEMKEWTHVIEPLWEWGNPASDLATASEPILQESVKWRGTWGPKVILELGCGGGEYSLELAARYPQATVVGVDIKGARLWNGARAALDRGLSNVRFLRIRIESLGLYFAENEVDEIWITFPNPHPNVGKERKRLTSPRFLEIYARLLKPHGLLHLKTDFGALHAYTVEMLQAEAAKGWLVEESLTDVYAVSRPETVVQAVQTFFERKYLAEGKAIKYVRARMEKI